MNSHEGGHVESRNRKRDLAQLYMYIDVGSLLPKVMYLESLLKVTAGHGDRKRDWNV